MHSVIQLKDYAGIQSNTPKIIIKFIRCKPDRGVGKFLRITQKQLGGMICNFYFSYLKPLDIDIC